MVNGRSRSGEDALSNLPPELARELLAELEDHAACERESVTTSGWPVVGSVEPAAVSALLNAYPLEQCRAMLVRADSGVIVSTVALLGFASFARELDPALEGSPAVAWLVQGLVVGILGACICWALQRASRIGPGALLSRLLQLSFVSVLGLMLAVHQPSHVKAGMLFSTSNWPSWADVRLLPWMCLLSAVVVFWQFRGRGWPLITGILVATLALCPGGPVTGTRYVWQVPIPATNLALDLAALSRAPQVKVSQTEYLLTISTLVPPKLPWHHSVRYHEEIGGALLATKELSSLTRGSLVQRESVLLAPIASPGMAWALFAILYPGLLIAALCLIVPQLRRRPADDMRIALCAIAVAALALAYAIPLVARPTTNLAAYADALRLALVGSSGESALICTISALALSVAAVAVGARRTITPLLAVPAESN